MSMLAMETKTIIVTMATKQPHFASSKKRKNKYDFHHLLSSRNRVICE
jgi:hypothetical protein